MSLVVLIIVEVVIWITINRNTPFSEKSRFDILQDATGTAAFFSGLYAALSFGFEPVTLLDPYHSLLFCLGNITLWAVLAVRQHSMAH